MPPPPIPAMMTRMMKMTMEKMLMPSNLVESMMRWYWQKQRYRWHWRWVR